MQLIKEKYSNRQLAGQRLMVGFDGLFFNDDLKFLIDTLKIGGIIFFSRNISSPEQVKDLCFQAQEYAVSAGQPRLFTAVDQEGGKVARFKEPFTIFPGNPFIKTKQDAQNFAKTVASELASVGINMNFAPVLDIAPQNMNSIMADRAFGHDPKTVSLLGAAVINNMQKNGIMAVAKHFPGIGRTVLDSHVDLPIFNAELEDILSFDILPFKKAVDTDVSSIMLSHILYSKIDPDFPASLSYKIAKEILREQMGYSGLVMTDDLDMGAVKGRYDIKTIIKQIISADIDIVMICHRSPDIEAAFECLLQYIDNSDEVREKTVESVRRILNTKNKQYLQGILSEKSRCEI